MKKTKSARLNLRCTDEFKSYVEENAEDLGMSTTEFIERCVMSTNIVYYDGLKELVPVMRKHGNNLNQIAYHLNCGYGFSAKMEETLVEYRNLIDLLYELVFEQKG